MSDPNGRFQRTEQPQVSPGACFVCAGIAGPFIQTGLHSEYMEVDNYTDTFGQEVKRGFLINGAVMFCKNCIAEMADVLDITTNVNDIEVGRAYMRGVEDTVGKIRRNIDEFFNVANADGFTRAISGISTGPVASEDGPGNVEAEPDGEEGSRISTGESTLESLGLDSL